MEDIMSKCPFKDCPICKGELKKVNYELICENQACPGVLFSDNIEDRGIREFIKLSEPTFVSKPRRVDVRK